MAEEVELCVEIPPNMEDVWEEALDVDRLCRACANTNESMIPIFEGDGIEHELQAKIAKHLPVKITKEDGLPHQMCFQCASTLVAWHDMFTNCIEAEKKLTNLVNKAKDAKDDEQELQEMEEMEEQVIEEEVIETSIAEDMAIEKFTTDVQERTVREMEMDDDNREDDVEAAREDDVEGIDENSGKKEDRAGTTIRDQCLTMSSSPPPSSSAFKVKSAIRINSIKLVEESSDPLFCMYCGRMFLAERELWIHINEDHINLDNALFSCAECKQPFQTESDLNRHMNDSVENSGSSSDQKSLVCTKCLSVLDNEAPLCLHVCNEEPAKLDFKCITCGQNFARSICLKFHQEKHHGTRHIAMVKCVDCDAYFNSLSDLKSHRLQYHGNSSNKNTRCVDVGDLELSESLNTRMKDEDDSAGDDKDPDYVPEQLEKIKTKPPKASRRKIKKTPKADVDDDDFDSASVKSDEISRHLDAQDSIEADNNERVVSCSLCSENYKDKFVLFEHLKTDHKPEDVEKDPFFLSMKSSVYCTRCNKYFARKVSLLKHNEKIHGEPYVRRKWSGMKDEVDEKLLKSAEVRMDDGLIIYRCVYCEKHIMTKRGYVRHVRIHTGERPCTCHICGKQYRSTTDLSRHLRCVHDGIKNHSCDICGRSFATKGTRNDHRRTHTGERPYMCHICGKSFPTPNSIYLHRRIHTDYFPLKCGLCDKSFRRQQQLVHHLRTHTGEKPHACDICGKCFAIKDEVTRHKRTHSKEKPFPCPICNVFFGQKRYVRNHLKTHHSEEINNDMQVL